MTDLYVSLAVVAVAVLVSEATRRAAARLPGVYGIFLLEAASTFQLCSSTHELKLLGESGRFGAQVGLTLCFTMTVINVLTFRQATCNPIGAAERFCRGTSSSHTAVVQVAGQFSAAIAAQFFATTMWSLGLSDIHIRHQRFGFRCFDPLGGTVLEAAAVELACAFCMQAAVMHVHKLQPILQVPFIAGVVTALVGAGAGISGAVFNPVLAFSIQFPCSGHTYLEYCFIYWLGPVLGVSSCVLLFEKIVPFLSGKSTVELRGAAAQKHKTQ